MAAVQCSLNGLRVFIIVVVCPRRSLISNRLVFGLLWSVPIALMFKFLHKRSFLSTTSHLFGSSIESMRRAA